MKSIISKKKYIFSMSTSTATIIFSVLSLSLLSSKSNEKSEPKSVSQKVKTEINDTTISLFLVGDMMGHQSMIDAAKLDNENKYDYSTWFQFLTPYVERTDFAMANLEVTLSGPPYSGYPQFCSPDSYAEAIKKAGFDFFITANNHSQDRGKKGVERTIDVLNELKIEHTGTFKDQKERDQNYPFIKTIKNKKFAFLNYTYGTNGLEVQFPNIVNKIDTIQIAKDLVKAKDLLADFIIVTLHWGKEYERNYNNDQKQLAQWLCDNGTDAIIGMHPHVVQPMEILHPKMDKTKNVPIAYSLGNCISSQRDQYKNGGIGVKLGLSVVEGKVKFSSWSFLPFWVRVGKSPKGFFLIPVSDWEKNPKKYDLDSEEIIKIKQFGSDTRSLLHEINEMK